MYAIGDRVECREVADRNHGSIVADASAVVSDWFDARFAAARGRDLRRPPLILTIAAQASEEEGPP
jgi:hypothetical protein